MRPRPTQVFESKPPVAIVLSAGGALGAYGVGVLKALTEGRSPALGHQPLEASILCGTSVGAFNAAFMAAQGDVPLNVAVERLEEIWLRKIAGHGSRNGVYRVRAFPPALGDQWFTNPLRSSWTMFQDGAVLSAASLQGFWRVASTGGPLVGRLLNFFNFADGIDSAPLARLIRENIDLAALVDSPRMTLFAVVNANDGIVRFVSGKQFKSLQAMVAVIQGSASFPGLFPAARLGQRRFVDGSAAVSTPAVPAVEAGAKTLHIIAPFYPFRRYSGSSVNQLYSVFLTALVTRMYMSARDLNFLRELDAVLEKSEGYLSAAHTAQLQKLISKHLNLIGNDLKVAIHIPPKPLDNGIQAVFDFRLSSIRKLIRQGYRDACLQANVNASLLFPNLFQGPASLAQGASAQWAVQDLKENLKDAS